MVSHLNVFHVKTLFSGEPLVFVLPRKCRKCRNVELLNKDFWLILNGDL